MVKYSFGKDACAYRKFRPEYPEALFKYLSSLTSEHKLAWDAATGSGQAASRLSNYYESVVASDIDQKQLDVAQAIDNVKYYCWPSERTEIESDSVDLITVAQAVHWFELDAFYQEAKRVGKNGAIIAVWGYSDTQITPEIDHITLRFTDEILSMKYWPKENYHVKTQYRELIFPFQKIDVPEIFSITKELDYSQLIGYFNSFSGTKIYEKKNGINPIEVIRKDLEVAWGDLAMKRTVIWPLFLLVGKIK